MFVLSSCFLAVVVVVVLLLLLSLLLLSLLLWPSLLLLTVFEKCPNISQRLQKKLVLSTTVTNKIDTFFVQNR